MSTPTDNHQIYQVITGKICLIVIGGCLVNLQKYSKVTTTAHRRFLLIRKVKVTVLI